MRRETTEGEGGGRPRSPRAKNPSAKSRVAIKWFFPSGTAAAAADRVHAGLRFDRGSIGRHRSTATR